MRTLVTIGRVLALALAACKGAERPRALPAASQTLAVVHPGSAIRGVAGDGTHVFAAFAQPDGKASTVEAWRGASVAWTAALGGAAGELVHTGPQVAVALSGAGTVTAGAPIELRGDPAAIVVALDAKTGAIAWRLPVDSTGWALVTSMAAAGNDLLVGGSFGGTLRIGSKVVSSAGGSDGFIARVTPVGALAWLVRVGGPGADGVQGVDATDARIAIAGTFSAGAELGGAPLSPVDEKSPFGDAFVAALDARGARVWSATFGSRADDAVAGVAIDGRGRVAVAASVRDVVRVGSAMVATQGTGDGLVVWYSGDGEQTAYGLVGGADFDGLRAIAALGDHVVVGGFFSGSLTLAGRPLEAGGGDDAFFASIDANGTVSTAWHVGGPGREEVTSLASIPGGFVAGVAHTAAATIEGDNVAAPSDPASGAALVVRGY